MLNIFRKHKTLKEATESEMKQLKKFLDKSRYFTCYSCNTKIYSIEKHPSCHKCGRKMLIVPPPKENKNSSIKMEDKNMTKTRLLCGSVTINTDCNITNEIVKAINDKGFDVDIEACKNDGHNYNAKLKIYKTIKNNFVKEK